MGYYKFKADKLFDGHRFLEQNKVLITDEEGRVEALVLAEEAGDDVQQLEGILTPGLINCHCHLELSHLKNVIPPQTGLVEFLCSVVTKRDFSPEIIQQEIVKAEKEMYDNGIVAVGDIGNTADTAEVKSKSKIRWQNFVEVLSFTDEKTEETFKHYKSVAKKLEAALRTSIIPHRTSLVPHAPYSISPKTFQLINEATKGQVISIHNQEHPAEDELYKTGGGGYLRLFQIFGIDKSPFPVTGKSSIRSVLPYFNNGQTILLIHNTFMPEEDVIWANEYAAIHGLKLVYCVCINANLYIENKVPPIDLLMKHNCHIVLGTDSYSSNWQLSIAKEMEAVQKYFPHIPIETILQWATSSGATALGWEDDLGNFKNGKRSGVILIDNGLASSRRLI
ncbi:MAG: amidohydrolase family protein [Chitinophagaceae bacterium]|jgi:cytosine/adenosine deaminase-related metal-dependent hydrolase|nr:amidohydrolase family protein [Chitinophagaceae bacterium]MBK7678460.1 amidohydrolase family protein [Chitinophagaceae bacterium]MBK9464231.1 amidohydrolase family protein [Chitinophagaceae bacterium]MBK9658646.1 amidohydrolase family protein [Chitinophagaceae bacterium]MBL0067096.1 amidohydrolase family protein [Chitinophagaceae bacterium]